MTIPTLPFARDDTMLGLCHALGEELGIPADALRVALALGMFWNPLAVIAGYVVAAVAANVLRWFFPLPQATTATVEVPVVQAHNDDDATPLARAA